MRILIINGHPDPDPDHFCHALCESYRAGAEEAGHDARALAVGAIDVPFIRNQADWRNGPLPEGIGHAQEAIAWCEHLVLVYPLWLGTMPAFLKAFLEQTFRQAFAFGEEDVQSLTARRLRGRSARIVVCMGMPGFVYQWFYCGHSLRALKRNILAFCGFSPVRTSVIGQVQRSVAHRERHLKRLRRLGTLGR